LPAFTSALTFDVNAFGDVLVLSGIR
jgi:hypothetical protein